ncbi:hypothetical protein J1614_005716 [Plenodomus biglobosus]|nr:hypothetical protein J1614_005716 [Plenodomus biglobosus]
MAEDFLFWSTPRDLELSTYSMSEFITSMENSIPRNHHVVVAGMVLLMVSTVGMFTFLVYVAQKPWMHPATFTFAGLSLTLHQMVFISLHRMLDLSKDNIVKRKATRVKKRYIANGIHASMADRLVFEKILLLKTSLFIHGIWFEIVGWTAATGDPHRKRHKHYQWLWEFMPPRDAEVTQATPSRLFQGVKMVFDLDSNTFFDALGAFYKDLCLSDGCDILWRALATQTQGLHLWSQPWKEICTILESSVTPTDGDAMTDARLHKQLDCLSSFDDSVDKSLADTKRYSRKYLTVTRPYQDCEFSTRWLKALPI